MAGMAKKQEHMTTTTLGGSSEFPETDPNYPDPDVLDLEDPAFEVIWDAIKGWDLRRPHCSGYAGATGNDVMHILIPLREAGLLR